MTVVTSPLVVLGVYLVLLLVTLPAAIWLASALGQSVAHIDLGSGAGDMVPGEWLNGERAGVARTFDARTLGFAAVLDNISAVLDAEPPPREILPSLVPWIAAWPLLVGAALVRYAVKGSRSAVDRGGWWRVVRPHVPHLISLAVMAVGAYSVILLVVRPLLFGAVLGAFASESPSQGTLLTVRAALYVLMGALMVVAAVVLDYARVAVVVRGFGSARAVRAALTFIRTNVGAVASLALFTAAPLLALFVGYLLADVLVGGRLGWSQVALGHAYVAARLVLALWNAAAQLSLFRQLDRSVPVAVSS